MRWNKKIYSIKSKTHTIARISGMGGRPNPAKEKHEAGREEEGRQWFRAVTEFFQVEARARLQRAGESRGGAS
jgi:hypothetical protein